MSLIRKLQKVGRNGSLSVVIPAEIAKSLHLRVHQRMSIKKTGGAIVIRDAKTKKRNSKSQKTSIK